MMQHELPSLLYAYDALEPYLDARTMEIHHTKHHAAYVTKLNEALEKNPAIAGRPLELLLRDLDRLPDGVRAAVKNNGGGHFNHSFFWKAMMPSGDGAMPLPSGTLAEKIGQTFGSFGAFQKEFTEAALGRFGSGWVWLTADESGGLAVSSTPNQDSPLSENFRPLIGLDVWEHAYYLRYQNRRADYVTAWWNVANWTFAESQYTAPIT